MYISGVCTCRNIACADEVLKVVCLPLSDSYAAATVVLQDNHKLILDALERHRDNATVVSSALNALEVKQSGPFNPILTASGNNISIRVIIHPLIGYIPNLLQISGTLTNLDTLRKQGVLISEVS